MSNTLSPQEISHRLIRLRNLERLYAEQKKRIGILEQLVKALKEENAILKKINDELHHVLEDFKLQIEELRTMVFGKKKKHGDDDDFRGPTEKIVRTPDSYRRPLPKEEDVTDTEHHPINVCTHCGGRIAEKEVVTYFMEDIPLPQKRGVVKHIVEKGQCATCGQWSATQPLPSAPVVLGQNVQRYVTYLSVICRQSYGQIQNILEHAYALALSQGEIAKILYREGERMRPDYERLKATIRGEPSLHLDETTWNLVMGDGYKRYAWTMTGGRSAESIFVLGKTRGKGNADDLIGESPAVVVSDDYPAYWKIDNPHQLCCAHILRKVRDLAASSELEGSIHNHCVSAYHTFQKIYADIEQARTSSDPRSAYSALYARLKSFAASRPLDPAKLARIKKQVGARTDRYLTCLLHRGVAADNNAAERSLRHLVLKRKISFGSFSQRTAETLAILCSVLLSFVQRGTMSGYLRGV